MKGKKEKHTREMKEEYEGKGSGSDTCFRERRWEEGHMIKEGVVKKRKEKDKKG